MYTYPTDIYTVIRSKKGGGVVVERQKIRSKRRKKYSPVALNTILKNCSFEKENKNRTSVLEHSEGCKLQGIPSKLVFSRRQY